MRNSWLTLEKKLVLAASSAASSAARRALLLVRPQVGHRAGDLRGRQLEEVAIAAIHRQEPADPDHQGADVAGPDPDRQHQRLVGRGGGRRIGDVGDRQDAGPVGPHDLVDDPGRHVAERPAGLRGQPARPGQGQRCRRRGDRPGRGRRTARRRRSRRAPARPGRRARPGRASRPAGSPER